MRCIHSTCVVRRGVAGRANAEGSVLAALNVQGFYNNNNKNNTLIGTTSNKIVMQQVAGPQCSTVLQHGWLAGGRERLFDTVRGSRVASATY